MRLSNLFDLFYLFDLSRLLGFLKALDFASPWSSLNEVGLFCFFLFFGVALERTFIGYFILHTFYSQPIGINQF